MRPLRPPLELPLPWSKYIYWPQRSCGQGNVFTGVCLSTGGEGVCLSACWDAIPPQDQADPPRWRPPLGPGRAPLDGEPPPNGEPPQDGEPPPGSRPQHTVYERPVRILLECIHVIFMRFFGKN